jgi:hypothetical protein
MRLAPRLDVDAPFAALDAAALRASFVDRDECVVLPDLIDRPLVDAMAGELSATFRGTRSRLPFIRSAAHLGYRWIQRHAPVTTGFYRSPAFLAFMSELTGKPMRLKDPQDDHACATYGYDRAGDGMRFHYDVCGCEPGASYTMILGLVDRSSQRLLLDLHRRDPTRRRLERIATAPGTMVVFCGSTTWHGVSSLGPDEKRMVLSMSYETGPTMSPRRRFSENLKDAVLYFGPSALLQRNYRRRSR